MKNMPNITCCYISNCDDFEQIKADTAGFGTAFARYLLLLGLSKAGDAYVL